MIFQKRRSYPIVLFTPREYFSSKNVKLNAKQWNYPAKNCFTVIIFEKRGFVTVVACNRIKQFSGWNLFSISKEWFYCFQEISWKTPNIGWMKCYGNSTKHNWNVCCTRLLRLLWDQLCLAQKAVFRFRRPGKMDGNVGCYEIYTKVLLTISNASLSSGNRKFTNHPVSGFLLAYSITENLFTLNIIKRAFKFILSIVLQKKKKNRRRNQKLASRITYAVLRMEGYWLVLYSGCTFWAK